MGTSDGINGLADEDGRWVLDEAQVTMLRGFAYVSGSTVRIDLDLTHSEAVLTVGGDQGERPTVMTVPVAIGPDVRDRLVNSLQGTVFHIGKHLRSEDTGISLHEHPEFRVIGPDGPCS